MQRTFKDIVKEQLPPQVMLVIAFVVMLVAGYLAWAILTAGTITVTAPFYQTEVYIDGVIAGTSRTAGEKLSFSYPVGKHEVIVSKTGFWPWMQNVNVLKSQPAELKPFLLEKTPKTEQIVRMSFDGTATKINQEYYAALAFFEKVSVPENMTSLVLAAGIKNARAADFFPGRNDVLLVAANQSIFAIDAKNTDPRNYQPVFTGTAPVFVKGADNALLVKDGDAIYMMKIVAPAL